MIHRYTVRAYFRTKTHKLTTPDLVAARYFARTKARHPECELAVLYAPEGYAMERYPHREEN